MPIVKSQQVAYPSNIPFRIISKTIGSGTYASSVILFPPGTPLWLTAFPCRVRKACPLDKPNPVIAVKFINKNHAFKAGRLRPKQLNIELSLHKSVCGHQNIIRFLASGEDESWVWMALELAEGGDLFDKIEADEGCSQDVAHLYFVQLVNAISFCHGKGVAHRDIKPENMLLSKDGNLKLADFGLATQFAIPGKESHGYKKCGMVCGSPPYIAPEILEIGELNQKRKARGEETDGYLPQVADIWSCAIVLFVLLTGNTPWDSPNKKESYEYHDYITSAGRPQDELWNKVPPDALSLLRGMLNPVPGDRFKIQGIKSHPWFTRANEQLGRDGMVANPIQLATQMLEAMRIDFSAPIPASQVMQSQQHCDMMDVDNTPIPSQRLLEPGLRADFASTQPDTPAAEGAFDWEAPPRLTMQPFSASQDTRPICSQQLTTADILDALAEDPSQTQFTRIPVTQMSATQQARAFNDIVPSYSLTRFYSHFSFSAILPLLTSALHRLNVPVGSIPQSALEGREEIVSLHIKTVDPRKEPLRGTMVIERVQVRGHTMAVLEVLEVRFIKLKGDPVGWRRLFKQVAVLCQEAIPRKHDGSILT